MKKYKAVLFDFDGVVADTMSDNFRAWKKTFYSFGIKISQSEYYILEGKTPHEIASIILNNHKKNYLPNDLAKIKQKEYQKNHQFFIYPQIKNIIEWLKNNRVKIALVSGSSKERLKQTFQALNPMLYTLFDWVITADDVKEGKPSAEPFLKAIKQLSMETKDCIVIENAPLGIKSAKTSGCYCLAITTTLSKEYLIQADEIFDNHLNLFRRLKEIF